VQKSGQFVWKPKLDPGVAHTWTGPELTASVHGLNSYTACCPSALDQSCKRLTMMLLTSFCPRRKRIDHNIVLLVSTLKRPTHVDIISWLQISWTRRLGERATH
jgi:hypothetical protein